LVYTEKRLSPDALHDYYSHQYRATITGGNDEVRIENIQEQAGRALALEEAVKDYLVGGTALDVGSSTGVWLELLRDKYKYSVVGVEPGIAFRAYSDTTDIPTYEDISQVRGKFDLITIIHTLEHIADPVAMLRQAYELAWDGATLVIEVPDIATEVTILRLAHPVAFSHKTLRMAMEQAGWGVVSVASHNGTMVNSAGKPRNGKACNILGIGKR
jgi:2-polyprenyl-3-methyl-5-hydroxy-6-metoxy-1,4-benzoquinol methylase